MGIVGGLDIHRRQIAFDYPDQRRGETPNGRIAPADPAAGSGPKRRAKTDRADARLLRDLLADGRLPESWIPPPQVLETRARLQLFKDLREQHTAWIQRLHAILLHHGAPALSGDLLGGENRRRLETGAGLSPAGRQAVAT